MIVDTAATCCGDKGGNVFRTSAGMPCTSTMKNSLAARGSSARILENSERRSGRSCPPTGGSNATTLVIGTPRAAAVRASRAPDEKPNTEALTPAAPMTAARSSHSRSTAYGSVLPDSPLPRRSYVITVNCRARAAGSCGWGVLRRQAITQLTTTSAGPPPSTDQAMGVPSAEWVSWDSGGAFMVFHALSDLVVNNYASRVARMAVQRTKVMRVADGPRTQPCGRRAPGSPYAER